MSHHCRCETSRQHQWCLARPPLTPLKVKPLLYRFYSGAFESQLIAPLLIHSGSSSVGHSPTLCVPLSLQNWTTCSLGYSLHVLLVGCFFVPDVFELQNPFPGIFNRSASILNGKSNMWKEEQWKVSISSTVENHNQLHLHRGTGGG